jgi:hypothetical protein
MIFRMSSISLRLEHVVIRSNTYREIYKITDAHQRSEDNQEPVASFAKLLINSFISTINTMLQCSPSRPLGHTTFKHSEQDANMDALSPNTARMSPFMIADAASLRRACSLSHLASITPHSCLIAWNTIEGARSAWKKCGGKIRIFDLDHPKPEQSVSACEHLSAPTSDPECRTAKS